MWVRRLGLDSFRLAYFLLVLTTLAAGEANAQPDQMLGATGNAVAGTPFAARCPQGLALVGLQLQAGDVIDRVQPLCARASSTTETSEPQPQTAYGGAGGTPVRILCQPGRPIVIGAALDAEGVDAPVMEGIMLYCGLATSSPQARPTTPGDAFLSRLVTSLATPGTAPPPPPAQPTHVDTGLPECPPGLVGVGVFGRAGDYVNQLGIICGDAGLPKVMGIGRAVERAPMTPAQSRQAAAEIAAAHAAAAAAHGGGQPPPPPPPASGDQMLPAVGDHSGGVAFTARCVEGLELVGLELRAGDVIDQAKPVCAEARTPSQALPRQPYPQAFGGGGGSPQSVYCPPDTPAVNAMFLRAQGIHSYVVHEIDLYCGLANAQSAITDNPAAKFSTPDQSCDDSFPFLGDCPGNPSDQLRCPPGSIGVGVYGRAGDYLDALGLICGAPHVQTSASQPPKAPEVIQRGDDTQRARHMAPRPH